MSDDAHDALRRAGATRPKEESVWLLSHGPPNSCRLALPLTVTRIPMATTAHPSPALSRGRPALSLALIVSFIAVHHWWVLTHQEMFPKLFLFLFTLAGLSAGGVVYPPAFYALTKYGTHLPNR